MDDKAATRRRLVEDTLAPWTSLANQFRGTDAPHGMDHMLRCWPVRYLDEVAMIMSVGSDIRGEPAGHYTDEPVAVIVRRDSRLRAYFTCVFLAQIKFPQFAHLSPQEIEDGIKRLRRLSGSDNLRLHRRILRQDLVHAV